VSVLEADMTWAGDRDDEREGAGSAGVLGRVAERRLTQRQAAKQLGLSERQLRRLCRALGQQGATGLVSRKRGG
jgi:molybdenum-dependent DNA-binding transcriptional regulator ModE